MKRWVGLVAATRLVAFMFTENLYGDSVVRTWLGYVWAQSPHVIGSFDQGGYQFGPLHLYLIGLATLLPLPLADSGRLVSLIAGVATTWPLLALTARLFGQRAVPFAAISFALWGLHIQFSTTACGEALNIFLVFACLHWLHEWFISKQRVWLLAAALMLNLACAARYDSWLFVPMLWALIWWQARDLRRACLFGAASMAFALPWMFGNFIDRGAPLFPFTYIDEFHRSWFPSERAMWGSWYRLLTLFFWPGTAIATLTPVAAALSFIGLFKAWRDVPSSRFIVVSIVLPSALYALRSTVLSSFVPLARFTAKEVSLLLPFAGCGAVWLASRLSVRAHRAVMAASLACAIIWPAWLGWFTYRTDGPLENTLRAISPVTTNALKTKQVASWLASKAAEGSVLIVDTDPRGYEDLQLAFYSGFNFEKLARLRSPMFERRVNGGDPRYLVRFEGGLLETSHQFEASTFRGLRFNEISGFAAPFHVYQRE